MLQGLCRIKDQPYLYVSYNLRFLSGFRGKDSKDIYDLASGFLRQP